MVPVAPEVAVVKEVVVVVPAVPPPATTTPPLLLVVLAVELTAAPPELVITPVQAAPAGQQATLPAWSRAQFVPEVQQAPPALRAVQAL